MGRRWFLLAAGLLTFAWAEPVLAAPDPQQGRTALVNATSGTVLVKEPGDSRFQELSKSPVLVRMGSTIDATRGHVRVRTARGKGRRLNDGVFWRGSFVLTQSDGAPGLTQLKLTGGDAGVCEAGTSAFRGGAGVRQRLWGKSKGNFKSKGRNGSGSSRGTTWLTEERCDGTRFSVKDGLVETDTQDGELVFEVEEDQVVQYRCDLKGIDPVSDGFCTSVYSVPSIGLWGGGLLNIGEAGTYDLCLTDPSGVERCEPYALSSPDDSGIRDSIVFCQADRGPGTYSLRWLIDGVQLGPSLGFTVRAPVGQGCTSQP
jgi:hypothetical protein